MSQPLIYLDHAAATPVDPMVLAAMQPFFAGNFYNPSATYGPALSVRKAVLAAREQVGHCLGAKASDIVFTAGGTEANNLAIHGVMRQFPDANLVISAIEHESVAAPAARYECREATVKPDGRISVEAVREQIDGHTVLVSVMYANNEIGTVQPLHDIGNLVAEMRQQRKKEGNTLPLYFHSDACQAANYLDLHVARLGVDLLTLNGGKIYGPKQSGALYIKAGTLLQPLIDGGGQERNIRSGTENIPAIIGFAAALEMSQTARTDESRRLQELQQNGLELVRQQLPHATINGSLKYRLPNNIHLTLPGTDNERILIQLEQAGILAAAGSACSASDEEASHVLKAIGLDDNHARASLRLTMGRGTTAEMIEQAVAELVRLSA